MTLSWNWNHEGELQERIVDASAGANLRGPIGLGCRHVDTLELFEGRRFGRAITDCGISVASLESLEWDADLGRGNLTHIAQIVRVIARQYDEAVGPWRAYLSLLEWKREG